MCAPRLTGGSKQEDPVVWFTGEGKLVTWGEGKDGTKGVSTRVQVPIPFEKNHQLRGGGQGFPSYSAVS